MKKNFSLFLLRLKGTDPQRAGAGAFSRASAAGVWVLTTNSSGPHASKVLAEDRLSTSGGRYGQLSAPRR